MGWVETVGRNRGGASNPSNVIYLKSPSQSVVSERKSIYSSKSLPATSSSSKTGTRTIKPTASLPFTACLSKRYTSSTKFLFRATPNKQSDGLLAVPLSDFQRCFVSTLTQSAFPEAFACAKRDVLEVMSSVFVVPSSRFRAFSVSGNTVRFCGCKRKVVNVSCWACIGRCMDKQSTALKIKRCVDGFGKAQEAVPEAPPRSRRRLVPTIARLSAARLVSWWRVPPHRQ